MCLAVVGRAMSIKGESHYLKNELYKLISEDETTFDFLQSTSLDGLWYWDLEHPENEWMSPEFWKTLGVDPHSKRHLAEEWKNLINTEDLEVSLQNFEKHLEDPTHPYDQVVRYRHENGSTVWVRCRGKAIRNKDGKPIRMLGAHNDITKLKEIELRYEKNLAALDEIYATTKLALEESSEVFNSSPDASLIVDDKGFIVKSNTEASNLFGYSESEFTNMNVDLLVPKSYRENHSSHRESYSENPSIRPMGKFRRGINATHKDGHEIPVEIRLSYINTRYGKNVLATIRDISEYQELIISLKETIEENEKLLVQSTTDPMTGLYNRRHFEENANKDIDNFRRHKSPLSVMVIDIDHFKRINDQYGHNIGDVVLLKISKIMKDIIRAGDTLARIGGEEFALLLPMTSINAAEVLAERLRHKIEKESNDVKEVDSSITVSIGVAQLREEDHSLNDFLGRADKALYKAKNQGRNRVFNFDNIEVFTG